MERDFLIKLLVRERYFVVVRNERGVIAKLRDIESAVVNDAGSHRCLHRMQTPRVYHGQPSAPLPSRNVRALNKTVL